MELLRLDELDLLLLLMLELDLLLELDRLLDLLLKELTLDDIEDSRQSAKIWNR